MHAIIFPGQGAQYVGMGKKLFELFPEITAQASQVLNYDIRELCLKDPEKKLNQTQYTQPALFVVNSLHYLQHLETNTTKINFFAGHSLGEYNALFASGAFDFKTGLQLIKQRGKLMSQAKDGGMLAILDMPSEKLEDILKESKIENISIANQNTPTQIILSGSKSAIEQAVIILKKTRARIMPLNVSGAFHSPLMQEAQDEFSIFLNQVTFNQIKTFVIANVTARPYPETNYSTLLCQQLSSPVLWCDSIRYLLGKNVKSFIEQGPRPILGKMISEIRQTKTPIIIDEHDTKQRHVIPINKLKKHQKQISNESYPESLINITAESLGSTKFKIDYKIRYAYITGSMYRGIASKELVVKMGNNDLIGFLGTGGLSLETIKDQIQYIESKLEKDKVYGINLLCNFNNPGYEMDLINLYIEHGIKYIEASAFINITPALVYYRVQGLYQDDNGNIHCRHMILAKISRPEVAEAFMQPAPEHIINNLVKQNMISNQQAIWATKIPMSHDICVEADSGGHTDMGVPTVLLPTIMKLRDRIMIAEKYQKKIRIGLAGGIGTPEAAASAFLMGADFILTGSINQCTVESGASDTVKTLLQNINVQDTEYAPAGDMFEIGAKVQVLKKGSFFAARANRLYAIYQHYDAIDEIPMKTLQSLEKLYFKKSIAEVWQETSAYLKASKLSEEFEQAEQNPKHKLALILKWYFFYSNQLAFEGKIEHKTDYQVHTGPALGAFNQWVKGTPLEQWVNRHVDEIAEMLMQETAKFLNQRINNILKIKHIA